MIRRRAGALGALTVVLALWAGAAFAQTGAVEVRISQVNFLPNGNTRVIASVFGDEVSGVLPLGAFQVTEEGNTVTGLTVEQLLQSETNRVDAVLAVDTSTSTRGAGLDAAKQGARAFLGGLPVGVRMGLVTFGGNVAVRSDLTADRAALTDAIDAMVAGGRSLLFDGMVQASEMLAVGGADQRNIVVFSDGDDDSVASLAQAKRSIQDAKSVVTAVALATRTTQENTLEQLVASTEGGAFFRAGDLSGLASALGRVAQTISSQYVLTYPSSAVEPNEIDIQVRVTVASAVDDDVVTVLNERRALAQRALTPVEVPKPIVPALATQTGLYIGLVALFAGVVILGLFVVVPPAHREAERVLARGLRPYTASERKGRRTKEDRKGEGGFLLQSMLGRQAIELLDKVPRSKAFDERMQRLLERAGWPLRATEFVAIQVGAVVLGAIVGLGLFRFPSGLVVMALAAVAPRTILKVKIQKRESAFLAQLPETLQLLAGSLQAGYGFLQAVDTVAKESSPPMSVEFGRVMVEARLGMPVEDALERMGERVGGEDFRWVVLAINIQRQVGGNLATLLTTVAHTLREREMVRRQIKTLSAEGRMSAMVLVLLPFFVAFYLYTVQRDYLRPLFEATLGKILVAISIVLMGIGIAWMRKIVNIDV